MEKGIKVKDIRDFEKAVERLNEVIDRIRVYKPTAELYVSNGSIRLLADDFEETADETVVSSMTLEHFDFGTGI